MAALRAFLWLTALSPALLQDDDPKAVEAECEKRIAEFKSDIEKAASPREKALAILKVGASPAKNSKLAAALGPYLKVRSEDPHLVLPWSAIDALSRFRGIPKAAQLLMAAQPRFAKIPYLGPKAFQAIAKVGHPVALPLLEKDLRSKDPARVRRAVEAMKEMPAATAFEILFEKWKEAEKSVKGKVLAPVMQKAAQDVADVSYPSISEMELWWKKRGKEFRERSAEEEKRRLSQEAATAPRVLPAPVFLELEFEQNTGARTVNTGILSGKIPAGRVTGAGWSFNPSHPWKGRRPGTSVDFGKAAHRSAVDLSGNLEFLRNLKSFTLMGWANLRSDEEGATGNRLISWFKEGVGGVELVYRKGGRLQLGVNEAASDSKALSTPHSLLVVDEKSAGSLDNCWWFFAVSYDSTAESRHVNFYISIDGASTRPVGTFDYARGSVAEKTSGVLSVGNVTPDRRSKVRDGGFRGLVDGVRIVGSREDGSGALSIMELRDHLGGGS